MEVAWEGLLREFGYGLACQGMGEVHAGGGNRVSGNQVGALNDSQSAVYAMSGKEERHSSKFLHYLYQMQGIEKSDAYEHAHRQEAGLMHRKQTCRFRTVRF